MKRMVTILVILFAIVACSVWGLATIQKTNQAVGAELDKIETQISQQEYEQAEQTASQLCDTWEQKETIFECYIKHDNVDQITRNLARIQMLIAIQDPDELMLEIADARYHLQHLYESELPLPGNLL